MIAKEGLLFIEPEGIGTVEPVVDELVLRMTAALNKGTKGTWSHGRNDFRVGDSWRGFHRCACAAWSGSQDIRLEDGQVTNSLCVHYLAHHRSEVPRIELAKVLCLPDEKAQPTSEQLDPRFSEAAQARMQEKA